MSMTLPLFLHSNLRLTMCGKKWNHHMDNLWPSFSTSINWVSMDKVIFQSCWQQLLSLIWEHKIFAPWLAFFEFLLSLTYHSSFLFVHLYPKTGARPLIMPCLYSQQSHFYHLTAIFHEPIHRWRRITAEKVHSLKSWQEVRDQMPGWDIPNPEICTANL